MLKPLTELEQETVFKKAATKLCKGKWYSAAYVKAILTIITVEMFGVDTKVPNVWGNPRFLARQGKSEFDSYRLLDYLYEPDAVDTLLGAKDAKETDIDSADMNEQLILTLYTDVVNDYRRDVPKRAVSTSEYLRCLDKVVALLGLLPDDGVKTSKTSNNELEIRI